MCCTTRAGPCAASQSPRTAAVSARCNASAATSTSIQASAGSAAGDGVPALDREVAAELGQQRVQSGVDRVRVVGGPQHFHELGASDRPPAVRAEVREEQSALAPGQCRLDAPPSILGDETAAEVDPRLRQGFRQRPSSGVDDNPQIQRRRGIRWQGRQLPRGDPGGGGPLGRGSDGRSRNRRSRASPAKPASLTRSVPTSSVWPRGIARLETRRPPFKRGGMDLVERRIASRASSTGCSTRRGAARGGSRWSAASEAGAWEDEPRAGVLRRAPGTESALWVWGACDPSRPPAPGAVPGHCRDRGSEASRSSAAVASLARACICDRCACAASSRSPIRRDRLEPGVAVVVGPNGSGKSNVADAIVWAAGSLTPSELRAEKPDDVLFAGGGERKAAEHCEVELLFDNEDGMLGELPFSEVSIARRLHRGGEGQYFVNRAAVRRTDLVELLADVGLGGAMHSIVGQGKVDAVLASRPADRRALVEEAAGLGKFKRRKHRAELKLAGSRRRSSVRSTSSRRCASACGRSPAGDRGRAGGEAPRRDRPAPRARRGARPRGRGRAARRRRSGGPPRLSPAAARPSGCRACSRSGNGRRTSSATLPAGARRRCPRFTGCGARPNGGRAPRVRGGAAESRGGGSAEAEAAAAVTDDGAAPASGEARGCSGGGTRGVGGERWSGRACTARARAARRARARGCAGGPGAACGPAGAAKPRRGRAAPRPPEARARARCSGSGRPGAPGGAQGVRGGPDRWPASRARRGS